MRSHWVVGQSQTGKSTHAVSAALDDIVSGHAVIFFDTYDAADLLLAHIPPNRHQDVVYFDVTDDAFPVPWNFLRSGDSQSAATITTALAGVWGYSDYSRSNIEQVLYNAILPMYARPAYSALALYQFLIDDNFRLKVTKTIKDPVLFQYWDSVNAKTVKDRDYLLSIVTGKIQKLVSDKRLRHVIGHPKSHMSFKTVLDDRLILVIKLPVAQLGTEITQTLATLLISQLVLELPTNQHPATLYLDNLYYYQNPLLIPLLRHARHYQLSIHATSSYLSELKPEYREALLALTTHMTVLKMSITDSAYLDKALDLSPGAPALHTFKPFDAYVITPTDASYTTLPPLAYRFVANQKKVIGISRAQHAVTKASAAATIAKFLT